jgi:hypothetical protein
MRAPRYEPSRGERDASRRLRRAVGLGPLLLTVAVAGCAGGPPPELGFGSRVRVRVDRSPGVRVVEGFLRSVSDDSLALDPVGPEQRLAIPRSALRSLEIYGTNPSADRAVETAAELGFAAGSIAAHAARPAERDEEDDGTSLGEFAAGLLGALVVGGATSLATGGGGSQWHTIPVSRLDALTRGRAEGPVTISLPGSAVESAGRVRGPGFDSDAAPDLDSG